MNSELVYILACVAAFLVFDFLLGPKRRSDARTVLWEYLYSIQKARREGTLGKPRLRRVNGQVHVIGYGQRYRVRTAVEGKRLIVRMNRQAQAHVTTQNAHGWPTAAH